MCVMSMIMDQKIHTWSPLVWPPVGEPVPPIADAEIREFRELLKRAREYDRTHGEPDCETAEKKDLLKKLAKELKVDISFIDEE